jgi:hypothetical protein
MDAKAAVTIGGTKVESRDRKGVERPAIILDSRNDAVRFII